MSPGAAPVLPDWVRLVLDRVEHAADFLLCGLVLDVWSWTSTPDPLSGMMVLFSSETMLYQSGRLGVVMAKMVCDVIRNRKEVYNISNQATVAEAARYLKDRHIRAAGVCNLSGKVIGVISQSDISDKVVAENYRPSEVMVQAVSSQNLVKIDAESSCQDAARIMNDKGIYHLVVEDAGGTFLGMISLRDCTMMRAEEESERADMLKDYAFPRY